MGYLQENVFAGLQIQRMNRIKKENGIPSGFPSLDKITGGWQDPGLIIVASRPNAGKSTFARDIAWHAAIDYGLTVRSTPVGFFSLEHSQDKIRRYFTLSHSGISSEENMFGEFEQAQTIMIAHVMDVAGLSIDDTPGLTITDFCSKAKRLVKNGRAKMIVIDYLHLMRDPKELWRSREDELKHILKELQTTAKELGIPIIVLFQMSKNAYFEQFDIDKSLGYIDNYTPYADTVIFLHRPFVDFPDNVIANGENPNKVRVIVVKNISGEVSETSLLLNTDRASFYTRIPCRRVLPTPLPDSPR